MCFTWGGVLWGTGGEKHGDDGGSIECTQMVFVCSPMNSNWALDCWMRVPIVSSSCIATQILQNKTSAKLAARQIVNWPSVTTKWLSFDTNIPNPPTAPICFPHSVKQSPHGPSIDVWIDSVQHTANITPTTRTTNSSSGNIWRTLCLFYCLILKFIALHLWAK